MNAFSPEKRTSIEACMVEEGFSMLKEGGLRNIRIDEIARKCCIAKGSFYSFFDTKAAFIYRIMIAATLLFRFCWYYSSALFQLQAVAECFPDDFSNNSISIERRIKDDRLQLSKIDFTVG